MKFGRMLRTTAEDLPEMQSLFVSYKQLKKQLKRLPYKDQLQGDGASSSSAALTEEENNFVAALSSTLQQMNDIFLEKEETGVIKIDQLESGLASATQPEQLDALHKEFVDFHGEVLLLVHWSILAYTATVKILKKHHKRTGLLLRAPQLGDLLSQPFCSTELMTGIAHRVEDDIAVLSRRLGKPPPTPNAAAAAPLLAGVPIPDELARVSSSALSNRGLDMQLLQRLADSESATTHSSDEEREPSVEGAAVEEDADMADDAVGGVVTSGVAVEGAAGEQQQQQQEGTEQQQQRQVDHVEQQQQQRQQEDRRDAAPCDVKRRRVDAASNAAGPELPMPASTAAEQPQTPAREHSAAPASDATLAEAGAAASISVPLAAAATAAAATAAAMAPSCNAAFPSAAQEGVADSGAASGDSEDGCDAGTERPHGSPLGAATASPGVTAAPAAGQVPVPVPPAVVAPVSGAGMGSGQGLGQHSAGMQQAAAQSIMRQTQVALTTWAHLKSSASTPSTMIAAPTRPQLPAASSTHTGASMA